MTAATCGAALIATLSAAFRAATDE